MKPKYLDYQAAHQFRSAPAHKLQSALQQKALRLEGELELVDLVDAQILVGPILVLPVSVRVLFVSSVDLSARSKSGSTSVCACLVRASSPSARSSPGPI